MLKNLGAAGFSMMGSNVMWKMRFCVLTLLLLASSCFAGFLLFSLRTRAAGEAGLLVGETSEAYATQASFQRKSFYANGRFWVFYAGVGNRLVYRSSVDGVSWSDEVFVRSGDYGPNISVYFDGVYVHYASVGVGGYPYESALYYRRGLPNGDGTITWSAGEQTVHTAYDKATNPQVAVDSYGYVWIGYREKNGDYRYPFVIKSESNDGTWGVTPSGFPFQLSSVAKNTWAVSPVPLAGGKMAVVFTGHFYGGPYGEPIHVKTWDGSAWRGEATTVSGSYHSMFYSAVAEGDDVHVVFMRYSRGSPLDIVYVKYSYAVNGFGAEVTLQPGIPQTDDGRDYCAPVISRDVVNGRLYVFWGFYPEFAHVYYRRWNGEFWEPRVDWLDEASEGFILDHTWTCFYESAGGYIGFLYLTGSSSPFNVKFAFLETRRLENVYLTLRVQPGTVKYHAGEELTFTVDVCNLNRPPLESTLTVSITGPGGYSYFDLDRITVSADAVGEYSFEWTAPAAKGKYDVEVSLVPAKLTAYDTLWLEVG